MRRSLNVIFKVTALAAALLSAYGSALADGQESSASFGIGNWNHDRPQAGVFDGMRKGNGFLLLDADILRRDDATGTWLGLKLRNLGLESREINGEWQRQGDIGASLEYSRIPRDNPLNFNTGVTGIGTTTQRVPAATIAVGAGSNVELGTVRDRTTAKFFKNLGDGLKLNVSFRNEDKDGTRQWGRGGAAEFAVEPINSTTRQLEATLNYARDRLQLAGGYYGTSYENAHKFVDTALTTVALATRYILTLPLDSKSHEVFVNGGYNFTPTTRGTFKFSYSRATQDERLPTADLGAILNSGVDARAPKNLGGRLDTTLLEAGITSKPLPNLSIVGNLRYRDFADKTPLQQYVFAGTTMWNTPFSYKTTTRKLEATYRLPQGYSLLGGVEYKTQDRSAPTIGEIVMPFRQQLDETSYRVQLRKSMSETVNGSLGYLHEKRDGGSDVLSSKAFENLIHPMHIADRKRDKLRATLDWSPMDKLTFQFSMDEGSDKYSGGSGPLGLQKGTARLYSADASYQVSSDWQVHAWISRDQSKADETTNLDTVGGRKFNALKETGTSFGLGVRGTAFGKLKLGGDLEQFRSVNQYKQTLVGGTLAATLVPPPDITNKMLRLKLFAQYPIQKNADLRFNLIYERWQTDDWSWMLFPATGAVPFTYGTATDGTTVTSNPKQSSTFVSVRYTYRFE